MKILEAIGDALIIVFGAFSLNLLGRIWWYGSVLCYEDNRVILASEIIIAIVFILLGINRIIDDVRRR